jgi:hypothetical protein
MAVMKPVSTSDDSERRASLVGVAEGLANEDDAAVLGNITPPPTHN